MGLGSVRAGKSVKGTITTDGTDGDTGDARVIRFDPPVRPCIVTNHCLNDEIIVSINQVTGVTPDGGTELANTFDGTNGPGMFIIPPRATMADASKDPPEGGPCFVDVSLGGLVAVHSVWVATTNANDDLDDVSVLGFRP